MPYRRLIFAINQFYHIYNRSVGNELVFGRKDYLRRALNLTDFYRFSPQISYSKFKALNQELRKIKQKSIYSSPPLVEIHSLAFMPNHFHFLLKQRQENGISTFVSNFQNSFAKYFNTKNDRHGSLFCEMFKAVYLESEEQLLHVSRYIHLNPVSSYLIEIDQSVSYPYTSLPYYLDESKDSFVTTDFILDFFKNKQGYKEFVFNQADYQRRLQDIKHLILEK